MRSPIHGRAHEAADPGSQQSGRTYRGSTVASLAVHVVVLTLALAIPVLRFTQILVEAPVMAAFVAPPPAPAPPPPPPPPAGRAAEARPIARPAPKHPETAAPIDMPLRQEAVATTGPVSPEDAVGVTGGVEGGVEGGVVGGVIGGVLGGIISEAAPPAPLAPVRVGGQIETPTLLHRVDPAYPDLALAARVTGVVILEAQVGTDGAVETVKVLRSRHKLLDAAAVAALRQWRYSPLILNETPTPFLATVTFTFSARGRR